MVCVVARVEAPRVPPVLRNARTASTLGAESEYPSSYIYCTPRVATLRDFASPYRTWSLVLVSKDAERKARAVARAEAGQLPVVVAGKRFEVHTRLRKRITCLCVTFTKSTSPFALL